MSDTINLKRIVLLARRGYPSIQSTTLISLLILFILLMLRAGSFHSYLDNEAFNARMFRLFLLFGVSLLASQAFRDLHDKRENFPWLMLPASTLEKFIAQLLLSTVLYTLLILVGFFLVTFAADTLGRILYANNVGVFWPSGLREFMVIPIAHSIHFLGAAFFRKNTFLKTTVMTLLLIITLFSLALFILYRMHPEISRPGLPDDLSIFRKYQELIQWIVYLVLPPVFWFIAYLKIKGTEISDGV